RQRDRRAWERSGRRTGHAWGTERKKTGSAPAPSRARSSVLGGDRPTAKAGGTREPRRAKLTVTSWETARAATGIGRSKRTPSGRHPPPQAYPRTVARTRRCPPKTSSKNVAKGAPAESATSKEREAKGTAYLAGPARRPALTP